MCKDTQIYQNGKAESHKFNTFNSTLKLNTALLSRRHAHIHCCLPALHQSYPQLSPSGNVPFALASRRVSDKNGSLHALKRHITGMWYDSLSGLKKQASPHVLITETACE